MTTTRFASKEALLAAMETWSLELVNAITKFSPNIYGVEVQGPVLQGLGRSEDLAVAVLTEEEYNNYYAGGWSIAKLNDEDESSYSLGYQITLFADQLDQAEFEAAVRLVAVVADNHDENLQARFGGKLWSET